MKTVLLRVSLRLTERDQDLLWLHADALRTTPRLVKSVIRAALRQDAVCLPLPPAPAQPLSAKIIAVKFYLDEDEDLVEWLSYIQPKKRSVVIKGVLRHAMECFDIRPYLIENAPQLRAAPRIEHSNRVPYRYPVYNKPAEPEQPYNHEASSTVKEEPKTQPVEEGQSADNWLSAFAELAGS